MTCQIVCLLVEGLCLVLSLAGDPYCSGCIAAPGKKMFLCAYGRGMRGGKASWEGEAQSRSRFYGIYDINNIEVTHTF